MAIFKSPTPADRSYGEAVHDAQQDWKRLAHAHFQNWSLDLTGAIRWTCSCSPSTPRNAAAMDAHLLQVIRQERGPTRPPKKK